MRAAAHVIRIWIEFTKNGYLQFYLFVDLFINNWRIVSSIYTKASSDSFLLILAVFHGFEFWNPSFSE